ncbi:class I SAM-dependent methyltransferase [bacterium]|nr:class I SAM-dependent methyltransferase [bacterium]NBX78369.1 class I SAM-dependent methyltransferase [bacterium]
MEQAYFNRGNNLETYLQLCTQYYDLEQHPYDADAVRFYLQHALQAGGPILEPMCGTGRFLIPIAQAGCDIEGFDASEFMLAACRQKYPQAQVQYAFAERFVPQRKYNLIFIPYGSWGLIVKKEDAIKGLQVLYDALVPGGKFIVDIDTVFSVPTHTDVWHRALNRREDGAVIALNTLPSYNADKQLFQCSCRYELLQQGKVTLVEEEFFEQYLYRHEEFLDVLRSVGFTHIVAYQDHTKSPLVNDRAQMIVYECTK